MLLIPDIHINTQYRDQIISKLSDIVTHHSDEKHIVLLGDYVYMFSYDRDALLALYKLLIGRYHEGKTIYVLAGNHDWHGQHFVYEEAKQAWDIINQALFSKEGGKGNETSDLKTIGAIHFITTPQIYSIEGESVLMMPYMIDWSSQIALFGKEGGKGNETGDSKTDSNNIPPEKEGDTSKTSGGRFLPHHSLYTALTQSTNKYEQASGWLNLTLEYYTQNHKIDTVIHHYYTADTQFPGLKTQFSYRDVALDPYWMSSGYDVISGHIHHPFVYGSYLCCGSLWNTAANETNQFKYYWIKHSKAIQGYQLQINPHLTIEYHDQTLQESDLQTHRDQLTTQHHHDLISDTYHISLTHQILQPNLVTLSIITTHQHDISQLINSSLTTTIKSAKPKYKTIINQDHSNLLIDTESLTTSVVKRKDTLIQYIDSKYHDQKDIYLNILEELEVLDTK